MAEQTIPVDSVFDIGFECRHCGTEVADEGLCPECHMDQAMYLWGEENE